MADLTASDEVLLGAAAIANGDSTKEFTEWQLTVATWALNKNRWGLRGFEQEHPDHKRVMNEIMGKGSIVEIGWLERPRPNHYRVTQAGFLRSLSLVPSRDTRQRSLHAYDAVKDYVFHKVFEAHDKDASEPRTWLGAAAFLGLQKHDPETLNAKLRTLKTAIAEATGYLDENKVDILRRGDAGRSIPREKLEKLSRFVAVLEERFKPQLDAIRSKAR